MFPPFKYAFPNILSQTTKFPVIPSYSGSFFQNQPIKKYQPEVEPQTKINIKKINTFSEINLFIDNKQIGKIIGKSGDRIEQIRNLSKAKVKIYDYKIGSKRQVKITGNTKNVELANKMIKQYLIQ
jgi:predicted RNA-binding protein YlqC (UPF0109 family)